MSHPAAPAFQSNATPAILPLSRLELTSSSPGRFTARSLPRRMPTVAQLQVGSAENVRPLSPAESDALFARIERIIDGARADLAQVVWS